MATATEQLQEMAAQLAASMLGRQEALQRELLDIEAKKRGIEAQLHEIELVPQRLRTYPAKDGPDYLCHHCWGSGAKAVLRSIPSPPREDHNVCNNCDRPVVFEYPR